MNIYVCTNLRFFDPIFPCLHFHTTSLIKLLYCICFWALWGYPPHPSLCRHHMYMPPYLYFASENHIIQDYIKLCSSQQHHIAILINLKAICFLQIAQSPTGPPLRSRRKESLMPPSLSWPPYSRNFGTVGNRRGNCSTWRKTAARNCPKEEGRGRGNAIRKGGGGGRNLPS